MKKYQPVTIVFASIITVGFALMAHEFGHLVVAWCTKSTPTLITAVEVRGDFETLSPAGFVALGISGSLVNFLFLVLGGVMLSQNPANRGTQLAAWYLFAFNGVLLTSKMLIEPIAGFGDWMTILRPFPATNVLRGMVAVLGFLGIIFFIRRSGAALAPFLSERDANLRAKEARQIISLGGIGAIILVAGAALASPQDMTRAILLYLGAGVGPFFPLVFSIRHASKHPKYFAEHSAGPLWPWAATAGIVMILMWFVIGPGISL
jgi:hypothetical protein